MQQLQSQQGVQQQQQQQQQDAASVSPAEQAKQRGNTAFAKQDYRQVKGWWQDASALSSGWTTSEEFP